MREFVRQMLTIVLCGLLMNGIAFANTQIEEESNHNSETEEQFVPQGEIDGLISHFDATMTQIGFFERRNKERLLRRIRRIFDRNGVQREEIDILRGFLKTVGQKTQ
ncbi:MAG: hypothetical protein J6U05_04190 [Neisseriaceae bacterium]|nr:hypothetical protein [Neisseriaceae bacterium]